MDDKSLLQVIVLFLLGALLVLLGVLVGVVVVGRCAAPGCAAPGPQPRGTVMGLVWNDDNSNGTMDPGETGVNGADVSVVGAAVNTGGQTDGNGNYSVANLADGVYVVTFKVAGVTKCQKNVTISNANTVVENCPVTP